MAERAAMIEAYESERSLSECLDVLLARPLPPRWKAPQPDPVIRRWTPSMLRPGQVARLPKICSRHPAIEAEEFLAYPEMIIRRMSRSPYRGIQAKFHSRKNNRTMRARALLEFKLFYLCEADPFVTGFIEQPIRLKYTDNDGNQRSHVPDLLVLREKEKVFVEVKREADAAKPHNEIRWSAIGPALAALGYTYEVLTERYIEHEPRAGTVKALFRGRKSRPECLEAIASLRAVMALNQTGIPISVLRERCPQLSIKEIYYLILRGYLSIDLNGELTPATVVKPGSRHG